MSENKYDVRVKNEGLGDYLISLELITDVQLPQFHQQFEDEQEIVADMNKILSESILESNTNSQFLKIGFIQSAQTRYLLKKSYEFQDGNLFIMSQRPENNSENASTIIYDKIKLEPFLSYSFSQQSIINIVHENFGINKLVYFNQKSKVFDVADFSATKMTELTKNINLNDIMNMNTRFFDL